MTSFTNFAFKATGGTQNRTMPDRLAEIKNVIDFGADPTGVADSTSAIQAAVNWTSGANRGVIYFPIGFYKTTAAITFNYDGNLSICFRGEVGSTISGNFNGYIFDRHLATPNNTPGGRIFERLNIQNGNATGGGIRLGSTIGGAIRDCSFNAFICLTTEDAVGVSSKNIHIESSVFANPTAASGSHYIIIGGGGSIQGCTLSGSDTAVRAYGSGLYIAGNRSERCNTSWLLGLDSGGNNVGLSGFSLVSCSAEGCWTAYDLAGLCDGFVISAAAHLGHDAGNAGVVKDIQGSQYGLRIRADCARNGVIEAFSTGNWHDIAAIAIADATSRANVVFRETTGLASSGPGADWILPTNAYTAGFRACNINPVWTYSQLPTGGNVLEGDEFDISDSNTATWGATAAGSGSNHVRVRYNGTNYTVVGK